MNSKQLTATSKFISLVLRHKPETIDITLDKHGWASSEELVNGLIEHGHNITVKELEYIVDTDEKKRYSFNEDKTLIRANQGHSINVDVGLKEVEPPDILYHGTSVNYLDSIMRDGIKPMSRLYVHLSRDTETANKVANRRKNPIVLTIDTKKMKDNNIKLYLSDNNVWLTKYIEPKYIIREEK